jgi:hypothetical protein
MQHAATGNGAMLTHFGKGCQEVETNNGFDNCTQQTTTTPIHLLNKHIPPMTPPFATLFSLSKEHILPLAREMRAIKATLSTVVLPACPSVRSAHARSLARTHLLPKAQFVSLTWIKASRATTAEDEFGQRVTQSGNGSLSTIAQKSDCVI